jgi:hypothetical protein
VRRNRTAKRHARLAAFQQPVDLDDGHGEVARRLERIGDETDVVAQRPQTLREPDRHMPRLAVRTAALEAEADDDETASGRDRAHAARLQA